MEVIIRKAKPEELRTIQDLNHELFISDHDCDPILNVNWPYEAGEDYFRKMISGEIGVCFVAEIDNKVVGYLAGCIKTNKPNFRPANCCELENMFVKDGFRNKGIGKKLVETFLKWCESNGLTEVFVSAYSPNKNAIEFYKKVGFKSFAVELKT